MHKSYIIVMDLFIKTSLKQLDVTAWAATNDHQQQSNNSTTNYIKFYCLIAKVHVCMRTIRCYDWLQFISTNYISLVKRYISIKPHYID